jgi:molybdopterin synthase catalytic subunit
MISVQSEDFSLEQEYQKLRTEAGDAGAIVTFTGIVRKLYDGSGDTSGTAETDTLYPEHYPGMTETSLANIVSAAEKKWALLAVRVIHRVGELKPKEQIVFVGTASGHRQDAFDAAQFIMDFLKSRAPFWKKQSAGKDSHWVDSRVSDAEALARWQDS